MPEAKIAEVAAASKLDTAVKSASDVLQAAIDSAVGEAIGKDPTLADDYAERDRLTTERKANAIALNACLQRIAAKEGPDVIQARVRQQIMALPPEQLQRLARGGPSVR